MADLFGTERQKTLQRRTLAMRDLTAATPGLYNAGRFIGIDDPDRLAEDEPERMLARDGILAFRMISPEQAARRFPPLQDRGYRIDRWDILVGEASCAGARASEIAAGPPPAGVSVMPPLTDAESTGTTAVQQFLVTNGLAPFPGGMLAAAPPHARTIVLTRDGRIVATGHAYFPHNAHSPFRDHAWIGLISVDSTSRGQGLGKLVSAMLTRSAFEELGARYVYAMVSPANAASRRMVEACGLRPEPALLCGVATPAEESRFTR